MTARRSRGIFDFDAVIASVLAATVLFMGMTAFTTGVHAFTEGASLLESERVAITAADYLVKDCALGVARCELGFAFPHEYGGRIGDAERALSNATGRGIRAYANQSAEGICAKRLMLNGSRAMVVAACAD
ncbi:MAG: hypothetical protein V1881_02885 [Candidatus Micrarchaeota archaeon]